MGYLEGDVVETNIAKRLQAFSQKLNISAEDAIVPYFQIFHLVQLLVYYLFRLVVQSIHLIAFVNL